MSRTTIITCDLCGQQMPSAAWAWQGADVCTSCQGTARPVGEVLEMIRKVVDGTYVSAEDIIPERTRRREK